MICSLCLKKIGEDQESVEIKGKLRHKTCSNEFEDMIQELKDIYDEDNQ